MKAHDVRRLRVCKCGDLALKEELICTGAEDVCGKCAFQALGVDGLVKLPPNELGKIRLDQVGRNNMLQIMERLQ